MHPCHAGPRLPRFMLSNLGAFVVNINIAVVTNTLPGEAVHMQGFGQCLCVMIMASHFVGRNSLISANHANKLGRRGATPQGYPVLEGGRLLFHSLWEVRASWWGGGYSQTWICNSSALLPSITNQRVGSPASIHFAASLLLVQMQLGDAE